MSDEALREEMLRLARALSEAQRDVIRRPLDELTERVDDIAAWQDGILHRLRKLEESAPTIPPGEWNAETVAQFNAPGLTLAEAREQALRVGREVDKRLAEEQAEPTPPAAEASEVEALARELHITEAFPIASDEIRAFWAERCDRHEAALRGEMATVNDALETTQRWLDQARKRAWKAEADLERLRDPGRERLIAAVVESCDCSNDCECDAAKLARYERARAKEKP